MIRAITVRQVYKVTVITTIHTNVRQVYISELCDYKNCLSVVMHWSDHVMSLHLFYSDSQQNNMTPNKTE